MKVINYRILTLGAAIALAPVSLLAQADPTTPTQTQQPTAPLPQTPTQSQQPTTPMSGMNTSQADSSGGMGVGGQVMADKMFVRKASEGGMAEVQLAQLALQKSSNDDVKMLANRMVTDHTALNTKMKPVADALGVPAPTQLNAQDQAEYDKLNGLSGADFDKEYLDFMVKDHHKDLREFRQESRTAADPQLKMTVTEGAKVIGEHTRMVDQVAAKNGVSVPQRNSGGMAPM